MEKKIEHGIVTWDWKADIDVDQLNSVCERVCAFGGRPFFHEVNTYSDENALLVTNYKLSTEEAQAIWDKEYDSFEEDEEE
jgi:hypothetical protein